MSKSLKKFCVYLLGFTVILLTGIGVRSNDRPANVYTVMPADSLWRLAEQFFSDPNRWREIWNANKHISDPHWIFPGDELRIPLPTASPTLVSTTPAKRWQSQTPLSDTIEQQPAYVDNLIDPNVAADSYFENLVDAQNSTSLLASIGQSIELHSQYRKTSLAEGTLDLGLHYIARHNTKNWGNFRVNLIALEESGYATGLSLQNLNGSGLPKNQSGVVRFSLEQYNLPLTERLTLNNIIGTHRQVRYNPFRERPNLINYRFGAAEPDVLGFSTQLLAGQTGLSVSAGRLGQSQGSLLPGFVRTSGNVRRLQATHVKERQAFTADVWNTRNQDAFGDRTGYRLGYDLLAGANTVLSFNAVGSGAQHAFLAGGSTTSERGQHDFGSYYFEKDIIWLDQRIGDDNVGGFYRYQTRTATHNWGASVEVRKDGLSNASSLQSTSAYISLNLAQRLSRRASLNHVYNFRNVSFSGSNQRSTREHSVRSYYSTSHARNSRTNINALARLRRDDREFMLGYGWGKDLQSDATLEFSTNYRMQFSPGGDAQEWLLNANWSKQFSSGTYLSAGLGYSFGRSALDDNQGFTSFLNLDQTFGPNFSLSLQLDYSRENTRYDNEDIADTFFTNDQFSDTPNSGSRQFFGLLTLKYQRGGGGAAEVLHSRGRATGSGAVRGFVFVDSNNDGIRQANEPGVPGVTVFLNSVYPVRTNSRGEYSFPNVGLGAHFLFIDESALPLPWTLSQSEYTPFNVTLRRSTQLNIAVSPITLAEAD